jgi:endonuclease YncB( thermonuclease family)
MKPTFIALLMCLCLSASGAGTFVGKVTSVFDGDTITVTTSDKKQFKIRLEGIDTPEGEQPFGDKATKALSAKVLNKQVTVTWTKLDQLHPATAGSLECVVVAFSVLEQAWREA